MTATDAYWFGLVDEVWGNSALFNGRLFEEFELDQPKNEEEENNAEAGRPSSSRDLSPTCKIDCDWEEAVTKSLGKKRPAEGWPK